MMTLNIIPELEKKELKIINLYIMIKNIVFLVLLISILIAMALLLAKYILQNQFNNTIQQTYLTAGINSFTSNEIKKFKQELKEAINIQQNFVPWSHFIANLQQLSNDGITFNFLKIERENLTLEIRGTAKNRSDLLDLQDKLTQSGFFEKFEIPKQVLFQKEDINFNLDLKITNLNSATEIK